MCNISIYTIDRSTYIYICITYTFLVLYHCLIWKKTELKKSMFYVISEYVVKPNVKFYLIQMLCFLHYIMPPLNQNPIKDT